MLNLSVELAPRSKRGLRLQNPVMVASGTVGYGTEYASLVCAQPDSLAVRLGGAVCRVRALPHDSHNGENQRPYDGPGSPHPERHGIHGACNLYR